MRAFGGQRGTAENTSLGDILSATSPYEKCSLSPATPDFIVAFEGYAVWADHQPRCWEGSERSLILDILLS